MRPLHLTHSIILNKIIELRNIDILTTVGQDIFADMIFLRILTKPRNYDVRGYDFNDLFTKKV